MSIDGHKTLSGGHYRLTEESFNSSLAHFFVSGHDQGKCQLTRANDLNRAEGIDLSRVPLRCVALTR